MDEKLEWNLANLRDTCVDADYLTELNGIDHPFDAQFGHDLDQFQGDRIKPCQDGKIHRYRFEGFLASQRLLSRNFASARLGMTPDSLDQLLTRLPAIGLSKKYEVYPGIIEASLSEDLIRTLPGLRFRTFGDHDSCCELMHAAIETAVGLTIIPLFCATADELGEQRSYAATWDNITLLPLSIKHSMWLNFGKPLSLPPDRCSKLFYARNHGKMRSYLAGREEPHDLKQYLSLAPRPV